MILSRAQALLKRPGVASLVSLGLASASCVHVPTIYKEDCGPWHKETIASTEAPGYAYFSGQGADTESEQAAYKDAEDDALYGFGKSCGVTVTSQIQIERSEVTVEAETHFTVTAHDHKGVEIRVTLKGILPELTCRITGEPGKKRYQAFVLLSANKAVNGGPEGCTAWDQLK